ncbi:pyocin activator PrtN family protein [Albidovulum sp.]
MADGPIKLPLIQIEGSQKSAKGVDLRDFASQHDQRREAARRECRQLHC